MDAFGDALEDAKTFLSRWQCDKKENNPPKHFDDDLLDFVYNYEVGTTYIVDFGFNPKPFQNHHGLVIGSLDISSIVIVEDTGEIKAFFLDSTLYRDVLLAPNTEAFTNILIKLIEYEDPFTVNREGDGALEKRLLAAIQEIVGSEVYMHYYRDRFSEDF